MLAEELLPFVVLVVGGIAIMIVALRRGRQHGRRLWQPTFENLHLLCVECEHELLAHSALGGGRCRYGASGSGEGRAVTACVCRLSRRRSFQTALTPFELVARKEMLHE